MLDRLEAELGDLRELGVRRTDWPSGGHPKGERELAPRWANAIRDSLERFLASYKSISVVVQGKAFFIAPPYFINVDGPGVNRLAVAKANRAAAVDGMKKLLRQCRFGEAQVGKATRSSIRDFIMSADANGLLTTDPRVGAEPTPERLRAFLIHYGIGIDCSGFVGQAINVLLDDIFPGLAADHRLRDPLGTHTSAFGGSNCRFERVREPQEIMPGDAMWRQGHVRIVTHVARGKDEYVLRTAESRSSNPADVGPAGHYWRLVPDPKADDRVFRGWRMESAAALPPQAWTANRHAHRFTHYVPLKRLLAANG